MGACACYPCHGGRRHPGAPQGGGAARVHVGGRSDSVAFCRQAVAVRARAASVGYSVHVASNAGYVLRCAAV